MCGIAGIFAPLVDRQKPIEEFVLRNMTDAIIHRGPDEGSVHIEKGVGFGHRRLSIIDVATGQQPLFNEDKSVVVVFNGEIYNYMEVVPELEALGHVFSTKSDTEIIVHGWEQWGVACLERFRGMFAFALWDRNQQTFFMARDRLGVKPMYYGKTSDGQLVFGSELKAITAHKGISLTIDQSAIEDYLTLGYVPDPKSIYQSVKKLAPGHYFLLKRGQAWAEPQQYWDAKFNPDESMKEQDAIDQIQLLLKESVKLRMISEVPLGAFLSGGVDSSVVVANMAELSSDAVKTCSISFDIASYDESEYAAQVAERYKTDHIVKKVTSNDFELIDLLTDAYDEPFADSSAIPTYRVCQLARERVTVALSGDGGDETFGGYRRYKFHVAEEKMRSILPLGIRKPIFGTLAKLYPQRNWMPRFIRGQSTFRGLSYDPVEAYTASVSIMKPAIRTGITSQRFKSSLQGYETLDAMRGYAEQSGTNDPLSLIQYLDYRTYLPGDINVKVDRASMQHSLETREPLMDHKLVEFAGTIPSRLKIKAGEGKYILKKAYEGHLSSDLLYRKKMGFAVPVDSWGRNELKDRVSKALTSERINDCGYFDQNGLKKLLNEHVSNQADHSSAIWALLMFERFLSKTV
jgi:asparagine synthase (glutamine-hydrolysing)